MKADLNQQSLIWLIGVLQPVSASELASHLSTGFGNYPGIPDENDILRFCRAQTDLKRLIRVNRDPDIFSLTSKGNRFLPRKHRLARDKARIYLLKKARDDRIIVSQEGFATGLGGVAPSPDERPNIKETETNKCVPSVPNGQTYWPRFSKQLIYKTGRSQPSCDIPYLPLISFADEKQLCVAAGINFDERKLNFTAIGLILGISPKLISQIYRKPERHYRHFTLRKKGGGERPIESPKVFLKVIQQFLNDYILARLPLHNCVHSYRSGHSIISNASLHAGRQFVANIDIQDFFGSVTLAQVKKHLVDAKFDEDAAEIIGGICCKDEALPQGAPTSPTISNSILFDLDENMHKYCKDSELVYSRYADDITISGDNRDLINQAISKARNLLKENYELSLNEQKTRIASRHGQQRVTGVVINDGMRPPRDFRRSIRAAFHNASKLETVDRKFAAKLQGYISYLMAFPDIRKSKSLKKYQQILKSLEIKERTDS